MPNNAKINIVGNLTKDPELKSWNGTSVVSFPVAVNTSKKDGDKYVSDFYNVSVWGKTGEFILPRLQKGTMVSVWGDLTLQTYTDKNTGAQRQSLSLRATEVLPLARQKSAPQRNNDDNDMGGEPF